MLFFIAAQFTTWLVHDCMQQARRRLPTVAGLPGIL
jgi:hypothetical protein